MFAVPSRDSLFTQLALVEGEQEATLAFYLPDDEDSTVGSDGLNVSPAWGDDGKDRRVTLSGVLSQIRGMDSLDPAPIAALAEGAMQALAAAL
ncbi:hypothetical protein FV242_26685 [Methylobacterium sp. WL64]|uniref:hypothetical protein n=1 Tax=Methylobacterium sp. WL64 TaxID=2603894 RepID=UPI0011D53EC1|nr:hypothetical protein [Methylobacterium sp. WL64]TXM99096.1 hypothetical protein FV242_26685 [Methylobacterium sp. WL64]